jgi:hypothetical protein
VSARVLLTVVMIGCAGMLAACESPCLNQPRHCTDRYTLNDCTGADVQQVRCPDDCLQQGFDGVSGCDEALTTNVCGCMHSGFDGCSAPERRCFGDALLICRDSETLQTVRDFWEAVDCSELCVSRGARYGVCAATADGDLKFDCYCDASSL